jgi:LL-diaminopimelate aminotransferase
MDYIQEMFAERIGGINFGIRTSLFKFEKIKRAKRLAIQEHPDIDLIDLGVGEPDSMADAAIVQKLNEQAHIWSNRGYADNGIIEFQRAASFYMDKVYGVRELIPEKEILHVMGSKSALSMLPQAFINPGDITLITVPGYPIMGTITEWLGGETYKLPLKSENFFLPKLSEIPEEIRNRAKLLYINYPNNPTGSVATKEFFEEVILFAKKYHIIVIQDAAYAALTFDNQKPLSFLSVPGAKEVGIEIHSLSKSFNMTGWRLGFACGNAKIIAALAAVKDNNDSGQFKAIQQAGIYALEHPELTVKTCEKYRRRHQQLEKVLSASGFTVNSPTASFYQYARIPYGTEDGIVFENAEQFSEYMIRKVLISTVPWDDEGHYVRFSVTFVAPDMIEEERVMNEISSRLKACKFVFR